MKTGVYQIRNILTGDVYVGSATNMDNRKSRHLSDLRKGKHHSIILQRAWDKYGAERFEFEPLEECDVSMLCERENHHMKRLTPVYNICKEAYSQVGRRHPEHVKDKIRKYVRENNVRPPASTYLQKMKKVAMLDKSSGKDIMEFDSLSEACRHVGRNSTFVTTISSCCNGKRNSAFGYKWRWSGDDAR